jgi:D-galacturonate reductase
MPMIAMGTATMTSRDTDPATKLAIIEAIKAGYRHFDTSALYGTEPVLGSALAEALNLGLIRSRDDLFITTKLWCNRAEPHLVLPAIQKSLQDLGLEYVDMYMIHWPFLIKQEEYQYPIPKDLIFPIDLRSIWEIMEECQNLGLTRAIGVSNFSPKKLDQILSFAKIPPAVNQVELNPVWQHKELREYCAAKNIKVSAWSPLGAPGNSWGDNRVIHCPILQDIAKSRGKTTAQVYLILSYICESIWINNMLLQSIFFVCTVYI